MGSTTQHDDLEAAMASIAQVRALAEESDALLVTLMRLDDDLTVVWRSQPGAAAILGLAPDEGVGRPAWDRMSPEGADAFRRGEHALLHGATSAVRYALRHQDGSMVDVVTTAWRAGPSHVVSVTVPARTST